MAGIDNALGISPQILMLRAQRMNLLSANLANVDTPNYKAQDIDFAAALRAATDDQQAAPTARTHDKHFQLDGTASQPDVMYRVPTHHAVNGNTVEGQREHTAFMDNAMRYSASLQLLDSRIKGLRAAIKGE